jgi:flavin-dependent dehydrogenase
MESEIDIDYDIIIVGARGVGAVLATRPGQWGYRVLLLEKASFPNDRLAMSFFAHPPYAFLKRSEC